MHHSVPHAVEFGRCQISWDSVYRGCDKALFSSALASLPDSILTLGIKGLCRFDTPRLFCELAVLLQNALKPPQDFHVTVKQVDQVENAQSWTPDTFIP